MKQLDPELLLRECRFKAVRSSGKGGQHVNKVSTSVELYFDVIHSSILTLEQIETIVLKLKNRISKDGELIVVSQSERSQLANKKKAIERFNLLIVKALHQKKKRIATKISVAKKKKRLDSKAKHAKKKVLRKKDWME